MIHQLTAAQFEAQVVFQPIISSWEDKNYLYYPCYSEGIFQKAIQLILLLLLSIQHKTISLSLIQSKFQISVLVVSCFKNFKIGNLNFYNLNMSTQFQAFTPSYENISNRLNRLRHSSANHSTPCISRNTPQSIPKNINIFTVQTPTQPRRRKSPTPILFTEEKFIDSGKSTGRVTKNVGLKKYNQRQLKQVMQCKLNVPLRTQGVENHRFKTQASPIQSILSNGNQKMLRWERTGQIKINQQQNQSPKSLYLEKQLIPGKLYKRSYLSNLLRQ